MEFLVGLLVMLYLVIIFTAVNPLFISLLLLGNKTANIKEDVTIIEVDNKTLPPYN